MIPVAWTFMSGTLGAGIALSNDCRDAKVFPKIAFHGHATDKNVHPTGIATRLGESSYGNRSFQEQLPPWRAGKWRFSGCFHRGQKYPTTADVRA